MSLWQLVAPGQVNYFVYFTVFGSIGLVVSNDLAVSYSQRSTIQVILVGTLTIT